MATPTNLPASQTTGNVLTAAYVNDLRGAFRILQVVSSSNAVVSLSTSATYADTGLTASITPQSTSSLILVVWSQDMFNQGSGTGVGVRLMRGSTVLDTIVDMTYGSASNNLQHGTATYLDTPSSVSALTYKTQYARTAGAGTAIVQPNNNRSSILLFEVSA
jgi:hypothetical protein